MPHFQSNGTNWKPLYELAVLESDSGKLPERITTARSAIFDRIEESLTHPVAGEQRAMNDALRHMRRLAQMIPQKTLPKPEPASRARFQTL